MTATRIPHESQLKVAEDVVWLRPSGTEAGIAATWHPDRAGSVCRIDEHDQRLLDLADGTVTLAEIAQTLRVDIETLEQQISRLQKLTAGIFMWRSASAEEAKRRERQIAAALRLKWQFEAATAVPTANAEFHADGIQDAHEQFDYVETTVSHFFRQRHPALADRSYGEAFCDWLLESGYIGANVRIIEIGCGVGYFANQVLNRLEEKAPDRYESLRYTMFDLSPELQASQQRQCVEHLAKIEFLHGNIEQYDFCQRQFDLVISNEVIADLSVGVVRPENLSAGTPQSNAEQLAVQYNLDCETEIRGSRTQVAINVGAINLVESLSGLLAAGGHAVVTEYGSANELPKAVQFVDHYEYSIHFGHLREVATQLQMTASLENLGEMLSFDENFEVLDLRSLNTLSRSLLPEIGCEGLPKIAYDRSMLHASLGDLLDRIGNLNFESLKTTETLTPFRFLALVLEKPST